MSDDTIQVHDRVSVRIPGNGLLFGIVLKTDYLSQSLKIQFDSGRVEWWSDRWVLKVKALETFPAPPPDGDSSGATHDSR